MKILLALALLTPGLALACETGERAVFSCQTAEGPLEVCQGKDAVSLSYAGEAWQSRNAQFSWERDSGSPGHLSEFSLDGEAGVFSFTVHEIDGSTPELIADLGLTQGGKTVYPDCKAGSIRFAPDNFKATPRSRADGAAP